MNWYIIQECWSAGYVHCEQQWPGTEEKAITEARRVLKDPCFEADYVRVLTLDCELVWDSREPARSQCRHGVLDDDGSPSAENHRDRCEDYQIPESEVSPK